MKKFSALAIVFLVLCAVCVLLMRSCGGDRKETASPSTQAPEMTQTTPAPATPAPTPTPVSTPEPTPAIEGSVWTTSDVNLRRAPGTDGEIITAVDKGTELQRVGLADNGWSKILWEDDITCYVSSDYLTTDNPANTTAGGISVTELRDTVWSTDGVNLRREPDVNSEIIAAVDKGTELQRVGIAENGWSKILYNNDVTCFVSSDYVTTTRPGETSDEEPRFTVTECSDTVWTTDGMNLRRGPGTTYEVATTVEKGTKLQRTGVTNDGWSRVLFDNVGYYVSSDYLTTEKPEDAAEEENEESSPVTPGSFETSGEFRSDTGVPLNLIVRWSVMDRKDGTKGLSLSASLSSCSLEAVSFADNLCFKVGNDTFNLTSPDISVSSDTETETPLGNCSCVVSSGSVPVKVIWHFRGTYSEKELDDIVASDTLLLG